MENRPKVGVGVCVIKDGKVLLGKRKNAHGEGTWCLPGGHLEFNESWEDCARREVLEETGMVVKNVRLAVVTNDIFPVEGKHYVTLCMAADYDSGEMKVMEPEKCEVWEWFNWDKPPQPLFIATENFLKSWNPFQSVLN
jgi:8-oxo-dGTP diphosphatase